jgi:hypothetical protein
MWRKRKNAKMKMEHKRAQTKDSTNGRSIVQVSYARMSTVATTLTTSPLVPVLTAYHSTHTPCSIAPSSFSHIIPR